MLLTGASQVGFTDGNVRFPPILALPAMGAPFPKLELARFDRWDSTSSFGGLRGATIRMKADVTISARVPGALSGGSRSPVLRALQS